MPFRIHDLTESALEWVKAEVAYFPGGIRDGLLSRDWAGVRLFAWLPADLPPELREPLDTSFVVRLGRNHSMDWTYTAAEIGHVQAHLVNAPGGVFLYQADYLRLNKGLPVPRASGENLVVFDLGPRAPQGERQEVWVYLDQGFEDSESVTLAMHRGKWPQHGLGVLTSLEPDSRGLMTGEVAAPNIMAELIVKARTILVPGWRGNAFIFVEFPTP